MRLLLTLNDVAEALSVSRRHVERLVSDGTLPSVKIGEARRVHQADLEVWLESERRRQRKETASAQRRASLRHAKRREEEPDGQPSA